MPFPNYKVHHLRRVMALVLGGLALLVLSGYVLGGCAGVTDVTPPSQVQTPITQDQSSTPPPLPTEQPTAPRPLPSPEQTAPIIPTPEPTLPPTFPPAPTLGPTKTYPPPLPTPTLMPPKPLANPVPEPSQPGVQWFASTGHTLRGAFLERWHRDGGVTRFGLPSTEEFVEASSLQDRAVTVQYFERAVFQRAHHAHNIETIGTSTIPTPPQVGTAETGKEQEVYVMASPPGAELARRKGYFSGSYPPYGHAIDYSWLSGYAPNQLPIYCTLPDCGCSLFLYEGPNIRAQLDGRTWRLLADYFQPQLIYEERLIVFGLMTPPGQVENHCIVEKDTMPVYVVDAVQSNPLP